MGFCCSRDGRAIVTGLNVPLRPPPSVPLSEQKTEKEENSVAPVERTEDLRTSSAPLKLDLAMDTPDLQLRYEQLIQEKREVVSSCSIVTVNRFGSPLSHIKESEASFESVPSAHNVGTVLRRLENATNESMDKGL